MINPTCVSQIILNLEPCIIYNIPVFHNRILRNISEENVSPTISSPPNHETQARLMLKFQGGNEILM